MMGRELEEEGWSFWFVLACWLRIVTPRHTPTSALSALLYEWRAVAST